MSATALIVAAGAVFAAFYIWVLVYCAVVEPKRDPRFPPPAVYRLLQANRQQRLAQVVERWPNLTERQRAAILKIARGQS